MLPTLLTPNVVTQLGTFAPAFATVNTAAGSQEGFTQQSGLVFAYSRDVDIAGAQVFDSHVDALASARALSAGDKAAVAVVQGADGKFHLKESKVFDYQHVTEVQADGSVNISGESQNRSSPLAFEQGALPTLPSWKGGGAGIVTQDSKLLTSTYVKFVDGDQIASADSSGNTYKHKLDLEMEAWETRKPDPFSVEQEKSFAETTPGSATHLDPLSGAMSLVGTGVVDITSIVGGRPTVMQGYVGKGAFHQANGFATLESAVAALQDATKGADVGAAVVVREGNRFYAHELLEQHVHDVPSRVFRPATYSYSPLAFEGFPTGIESDLFKWATAGVAAVVDGATAVIPVMD